MSNKGGNVSYRLRAVDQKKKKFVKFYLHDKLLICHTRLIGRCLKCCFQQFACSAVHSTMSVEKVRRHCAQLYYQTTVTYG